MAMTPGQTAKQWAKEHRDAEGLLTVRSITPAGRGGWKTKTKRTRFYVQAGEARMMGGRKNPEYLDDRWNRYLENGRCYRCGQLFLKPVLRERYVRNPNAGQPATASWIPADRDVRQYRYCVAPLCPVCDEGDGLTHMEFVQLGYQDEVKSDPKLHLEWIGPSEGVPDLGTIGACWTATDGRGHSGPHPRPSNQEVTA